MAASSASYVPPTSIPTHTHGGYHNPYPGGIAMVDENGQYVPYGLRTYLLTYMSNDQHMSLICMYVYL
jgi:hypothetical protein